MEIAGDGFILREWRNSDSSSLAENADNIKVWNNVRDYFPHPYTQADARVFIGTVQGRTPQTDFAVVVGGRAVGGVGFVPQSDVERLSAEIGYWLGEPYWGRGIMPRAVTAVAEYVFRETEIIRLFAPVFGFNRTSMRVLEKAGFEKAGVMRRAAVKNGQITDLYYYELLK